MMYDVVNLYNSFNFSPFAIRYSLFCRKFAARLKNRTRENRLCHSKELYSLHSACSVLATRIIKGCSLMRRAEIKPSIPDSGNTDVGMIKLNLLSRLCLHPFIV